MSDLLGKLYYPRKILTFYRFYCINMFLLTASQWVFFFFLQALDISNRRVLPEREGHNKKEEEG